MREHLATVPDDATTSGRWVDAIDIRVGDELLLRDGRTSPVEAVRQQSYQGKVYNFHVDDLQCYAVGLNSVLVHNDNGGKVALGIEGYLEEFAASQGAMFWKQLGDPMNWKTTFLALFGGGKTRFVFNLTGVQVWEGVFRGKQRCQEPKTTVPDTFDLALPPLMRSSSIP